MALGDFGVGGIAKRGDQKRRVEPGHENADLIRGALIDAKTPGDRDVVPRPAPATDNDEKPVPCGNLFKDREIGLYPLFSSSGIRIDPPSEITTVFIALVFVQDAHIELF